MDAHRASWVLKNFNSDGLLPVKPAVGLGYPHLKGLSRGELTEAIELCREMNDALTAEEREIKFYSIESALQKIAGTATIKFYESIMVNGEEFINIGNELNE